MHALENIKEKLMDELKEYDNKPLSMGDLDTIDKLAHSIKNICKIIKSLEESQYSGNNSYGVYYDGEAYRDNPYNYARDGRSYSMQRGRNQSARRDSMGRYSSDSQQMISELKDLIRNTPDEYTRMELSKLLQNME